jgi:23S rRNA (pseudouridine1915-N3)-methyltransferase
MNSIQIICIGKIKEPYLISGIQEFSKRLKPYAKLDIIELEECKSTQNPTTSELQVVINEESQRIADKLPKDAYVFALAIEGTQYSSEEFAKRIDEISIYQTNKIVFIIGGSHGLSATLKNSVHQTLSFSKSTFPHQLMRLILLEQVYRAVTILHHLPYHK